MLRLLASRPLLVAGPAAALGVALAAAPLGWTGAAILLLLAWAALRRAMVPALAATALAAGHAAAAADLARVRPLLETWPRAPPGPVEFTLDVTRCGEDPFHGRAWLEGRPPEGPGLRCTFAGPLPLGVGPGAVVRVAGRCRGVPPPGNPGEADRRLALARRGVGLLCELRTAENVEVLARAPWSLSGFLAGVRRGAAARLGADLPPDVAPLAVAFLLGDRTGLSEDDRLVFERTGTAHILAISGMHVLLLAGMVHALLRAIGLGPRAAAGITLALALAYVPVAGAGAPVRRAVAVLAFHGLALVRGRPPDAGSALGGAALVLALLDPREMLGVGSQLSFVATAGILWLAGRWQDRWSGRYRLLRRFPAVRHDRPVLLAVTGYLLSAVPVALAAWLSTLALVARAFGVVTPYAPATNVVVGPLAALFLAASALAALAVPGAAPAAACLARAMRAVLAHGGDLPASLWVVPSPPVAAVALWLLACVLLRWRKRVALPLLAAAVALAVATRPAPPRDPELVLFDVGHGQAALIRSPDGRTVLVDAGSRTRPGVGRAVLLPALRSLGITRIDVAVVTHADSDHWSAIPLLLARFPVGAILAGPDPPPEIVRASEAAGVPCLLARRGTTILDVADARLSVRAGGDGSFSDNDSSIVLLLESRGHRVLLPADREERGLRGLFAEGVPACDVLVAPHHGARCDEALALGRALRPRLLLVSTSPGFPDPPTLARYGAARTLLTCDEGAITVRFAGRGAIDVLACRGGGGATIRTP